MNTVTTTNKPTLQRGSQGQAVKELQQLLNREFGARKQIAVDGVFGPATETAVKTIQYRFFLTQDGIAGSKTWFVLRTRTLFDKPLLKRGSTGEMVKRVQQVLKSGGFYNGVLDGDFGPQTERAVTAFQQGQSLRADGVIGDQTWQALVELATILTAG